MTEGNELDFIFDITKRKTKKKVKQQEDFQLVLPPLPTPPSTYLPSFDLSVMSSDIFLSPTNEITIHYLHNKNLMNDTAVIVLLSPTDWDGGKDVNKFLQSIVATIINDVPVDVYVINIDDCITSGGPAEFVLDLQHFIDKVLLEHGTAHLLSMCLLGTLLFTRCFQSTFCKVFAFHWTGLRHLILQQPVPVLFTAGFNLGNSLAAYTAASAICRLECLIFDLVEFLLLGISCGSYWATHRPSSSIIISFLQHQPPKGGEEVEVEDRNTGGDRNTTAAVTASSLTDPSPAAADAFLSSSQLIPVLLPQLAVTHHPLKWMISYFNLIFYKPFAKNALIFNITLSSFTLLEDINKLLTM